MRYSLNLFWVVLEVITEAFRGLSRERLPGIRTGTSSSRKDFTSLKKYSEIKFQNTPNIFHQ